MRQHVDLERVLARHDEHVAVRLAGRHARRARDALQDIHVAALGVEEGDQVDRRHVDPLAQHAAVADDLEPRVAPRAQGLQHLLPAAHGHAPVHAPRQEARAVALERGEHREHARGRLARAQARARARASGSGSGLGIGLGL